MFKRGTVRTTPNYTRRASSELDEPFDDLMRKAGVVLPDHLSTRYRRWASLLLVALSGAFASGPLESWPTLQPLLIDEGVFAGSHQSATLSSLYCVSRGVALMSILFGGIFYDAMGPRVTSLVGACGAAACLSLMGLAIKFQSLNHMLWFAYPAASFFGFVNSLGCYAWLMLLPDEQNTVTAVTGAVQALSDSCVLIAVLLNNRFGIPLHNYFQLTASLALVTALLGWILVPSREVHVKVTSIVLAAQKRERNGDSYGAVRPSQTEIQNEPEEESFFVVLASSLVKVKQVLRCCTLYPTANVLFLAYNVVANMFVGILWFNMYDLYCALMGKSEGVKLVTIFGGVYSVMGAASLLLFGRISDRIGFESSLALVIIPVLAATVLVHIPSVDAQVGCQVLMSLLSNTWIVLVPRFCLSYAPPELFGTMFGLISMTIGACQICLTPLSRVVSEAFVHETYPHANLKQGLPFLYQFDAWCCLQLSISLSLLAYFWSRPLPPQGHMTMADVRNGFLSEDEHGQDSRLNHNQSESPAGGAHDQNSSAHVEAEGPPEKRSDGSGKHAVGSGKRSSGSENSRRSDGSLRRDSKV